MWSLLWSQLMKTQGYAVRTIFSYLKRRSFLYQQNTAFNPVMGWGWAEAKKQKNIHTHGFIQYHWIPRRARNGISANRFNSRLYSNFSYLYVVCFPDIETIREKYALLVSCPWVPGIFLTLTSYFGFLNQHLKKKFLPIFYYMLKHRVKSV